VDQGKLLNVSQGGLLITPISDLEINDSLSLMISIPQIFPFEKLPLSQINYLVLEGPEFTLFRATGRLVRKEMLTGNLGLEWENKSQELDETILSFAEGTLKNIVYVLRLFQNESPDEKQLNIMRKFVQLFGHVIHLNTPMGELKKLVEKDYYSLKFL
jgi:hypothetical protein